MSGFKDSVVCSVVVTKKTLSNPQFGSTGCAANHLVKYNLVLAADVRDFFLLFVLILLDPSTTLTNVFLQGSVHCAVLLTLASETGQESLTLYLILKIPLDLRSYIFNPISQPRLRSNTGKYM